MSNRPWEKRLGDLAHTLLACGKTYFDPELFRRNTNNFLQTARTVTFIIQKNKSSIPDFEDWYSVNVINAWKEDSIMQWTKDARNVIEKEGDLDLFSHIHVILMYSYLEEEDIKINCGRNELLNFGIKKLIRFAQKQLPSGISAVAGIKVERQWRTAKLESNELLQAISYVYARLHDCCRALAIYLGDTLAEKVPDPSTVGLFQEDARQIEFVKLKDFQTYRLTTQRVHYEPERVPESFKAKTSHIRESVGKIDSFSAAIGFFRSMAEATFAEWGHHVPMLFLLSDNWVIQDSMTPAFGDQSDKYFFWRAIAERVEIQRSHFLVFISEMWVRDMRNHPIIPISKMPIIGEKLQIAAIDGSGNKFVGSWDIIEDQATRTKKLGKLEESDLSKQRFSFLTPVLRSMGVESKPSTGQG